jgi:hypothetical protein
MHQETASEQRPFSQLVEQQSASPSHSLPEVRHSVFSAWQLPSEQTPPQHSASVLQAPLSETQRSSLQLPASQRKEQQSVAAAQSVPSDPH